MDNVEYTPFDYDMAISNLKYLDETLAKLKSYVNCLANQEDITYDTRDYMLYLLDEFSQSLTFDDRGKDPSLKLFLDFAIPVLEDACGLSEED